MGRLVEPHLDPLRWWARGRPPVWARDLADTDDVVQETLPQTFKCMDGFEPERSDRALVRLRPEEQEAVIGRVGMGHSYTELAEALGKPTADGAREAAQRALVRLAEEMTHAD